MGARTGIAWTDATWNVLRGCSRISAGCQRCYAERDAGRMSSGAYDGLVKKMGDEWRWTGEVRFVPELLDVPLRWRRPRRIFVNSMSDMFHEKVERSWLDAIFGVMARAVHERGHSFQVLTKRPERMCDELKRYAAHYDAGDLSDMLGPDDGYTPFDDAWFPFKGIWLGVSVEDQATADARIPRLLQTPAAVRFVSYEPALEAVDFTRLRNDWGGSVDMVIDALGGKTVAAWCGRRTVPDYDIGVKLDWLILGGESGPGHRPLEIAWVDSVAAQCQAANIPLFVKQDSGYRAGQQGRIPDRLWARKEFPR